MTPMRRAAISGLVVMGLALAGCGAATLTESAAVSVEAAPGIQGQTALSAPRPRLTGGLPAPGELIAQPAPRSIVTGPPPVADGEAPVAVPPSPREVASPT